MTNGTGTTGSGQGWTGQSSSSNQLLELSTRAAQAAHQGTKQILTLMRSNGGDQDPDDPVAAIAELLLQAEERDRAMAVALDTMRGTLEGLAQTVAAIRADQATASEQTAAWYREFRPLKAQLESFFDQLQSQLQNRPAGGSGGGPPR